jgi:hypothetical protein
MRESCDRNASYDSLSSLGQSKDHIDVPLIRQKISNHHDVNTQEQWPHHEREGKLKARPCPARLFSTINASNNFSRESNYNTSSGCREALAG